MIEGIFVEKVLTHPNIRPYPVEPQETSGYYAGSQSLLVPEVLYDNAGGIINPGYYELALTDSREYLILMQSKEPVAVIPVIKIEEDATESARLNNKKVKKELKKEQKNRENTNKKRAKTGQTLDEPEIFMNADIEYNKEGRYFLIKYERGQIRAWGVFKG